MDQDFINQFMAHIRCDDALFGNFLSAARDGTNTAFMSTKNETLIVDDSWVYTIDGVLYNIEKIARDPRKFIAEHENIVDVERARKTTAKTVRHLAAHSGNVRNIKDDGEVVPKKLLTIELDEEIAIYENRFIGTLVHRLVNFVELRKTDIEEHFRMQDETSLNVKSNFKYGESNVEYEMKVLVQALPEDRDYLAKVKELLEKIDEIRKRLRILLATPFMRTIDKAKPVRPPIQKTNLLRMQQDYRNCYQLWLYISSYTAVGYSIDIKDKTLPVDGDYFDDLTVLTAMSVKSMVENNLLRKDSYDAVEYSDTQRKNYKSMTKYDFEVQFKYDKEAAQVEDSINEYYYQQMKRAFSREAHRPVTDDPALVEKELKTSFMRYFNTVSKINNEMYLDLIKKQAPAAVGRSPLQKQQANLEQQNVLIKRLHQLTSLKTQDLERTAKLEKRELARAEQIKQAIAREQSKLDRVKLAKEREKEKAAKAKERARQLKETERKKKELAAQKEAAAKQRAKLAAQREIEKAAAQKQKEKDKKKKEAELPAAAAKPESGANKPAKAAGGRKSAASGSKPKPQEEIGKPDTGTDARRAETDEELFDELERAFRLTEAAATAEAPEEPNRSEPAESESFFYGDGINSDETRETDPEQPSESDLSDELSEALIRAASGETDGAPAPETEAAEPDTDGSAPAQAEAGGKSRSDRNRKKTAEKEKKKPGASLRESKDPTPAEERQSPQSASTIDFSVLEAEFEQSIYSPMEDFESGSGDKK